MATIRTFEEIEAWQQARVFAREIYEITRAGAFSRDPDLRGQLRRAAVSAVSNTAEGFEREGRAEFINFLGIAKGSLGEAEAQLYVALDQSYITNEQFKALKERARTAKKLTAGFIDYLRSSALRGQKFKRVAPESSDGLPETGNRKLETGNRGDAHGQQ